MAITILMVIAVILLFLAALPLPFSTAPISLGWLGLFFGGLAFLLQRLGA